MMGFVGMLGKLGGVLKVYTATQEVDRKLRALKPGEAVTLPFPEDQELKFDGKSGKRFEVISLTVRRLP